MSETQLSRRHTTSSDLALWAIQEAKRRIEARRDLVDYAARNLWIEDKRKQKRRFILNAAQRDYLNNRTPYDLILKARQLGFSTLIQGDFMRHVVNGAA